MKHYLNWIKYHSYGSEWVKAYFDELSGGYTVYHKHHKFTETGGGGEAEKIVGKILAKYNGKQVEFLPEGVEKSPDNAIEREAGRFFKGQINKLPDIYVIDRDGLLKLLWEKPKGTK